MIRPRPISTLARTLAVSAAAMLLATSIGLAGPAAKKPTVKPATAARASGRTVPAHRAVAPRLAPLSEAQRMELAKTARELEEVGAYTRAAIALGRLRAGTPPDADLDLALALDLARIGRPEGAESLLVAPALTAALTDTLPVQRRHLYPWERETLWTNGRFDGWSWYVWRARAGAGPPISAGKFPTWTIRGSGRS